MGPMETRGGWGGLGCSSGLCSPGEPFGCRAHALQGREPTAVSETAPLSTRESTSRDRGPAARRAGRGGAGLLACAAHSQPETGRKHDKDDSDGCLEREMSIPGRDCGQTEDTNAYEDQLQASRRSLNTIATTNREASC